MYVVGISAKSNPNSVSVEKINFRFPTHFILPSGSLFPEYINFPNDRCSSLLLGNFPFLRSSPEVLYTGYMAKVSPSRRLGWFRRESCEIPFRRENQLSIFLPNGSRLMQYLPIFPRQLRESAREVDRQRRGRRIFDHVSMACACTRCEGGLTIDVSTL